VILAFLRLQADYAPGAPSTVKAVDAPNAAGRRHPGRQGLHHALSRPTPTQPSVCGLKTEYCSAECSVRPYGDGAFLRVGPPPSLPAGRANRPHFPLEALQSGAGSVLAAAEARQRCLRGPKEHNARARGRGCPDD
jgi:hypothetical protein